MQNKKGADTWQVIFGLIMTVLILIAVGYWFVTKFSKGTETLEQYEKSTVEAMIQSCNLVSTPYGFCEDWKTVTSTGGKVNYVNCKWSKLSGISNPIACLQSDDVLAKAKCATLTGVDPTKVFVNDKACSAWTDSTTPAIS